MQKKAKTSHSPSILSIIAKAICPRQTWNDKVIHRVFLLAGKMIASNLGSVYGRDSLDASAASINYWLYMGNYPTARHRGATFVSIK